jgi:RNA polymerase sigma-70 factor (ECF subfamily)
MPEVIDHLFRNEAGRMLAALTRVLGVHNLSLAEDVVQDTLLRALESWKYGKIPENPAAWLMTAAQNRAIDLIRRENTRRKFAPDLLLESEWTLRSTVEASFAAHEIRDDELRMMFSCCAPSISSDSQVALILKLLCGFSVAEIASAFLSSEAAIEKQIQRGKKALAEAELFALSRDAIVERLPAVESALYLLFNEGYQSSHRDQAVRADLCNEAIRLTTLLVEHPTATSSRTRALLALLCLDAARLPARVDEHGELVLLEDQDRMKWDRSLIQRGLLELDAATEHGDVSELHIEAAIAATHSNAPSVSDTNWRQIVELYDALLRFRPSPIVQLNRAIALGRARTPDEGLAALDEISDERMNDYPYYWAARGDLHERAGRADQARQAFGRALEVAQTSAQKQQLQKRLQRFMQS